MSETRFGGRFYGWFGARQGKATSVGTKLHPEDNVSGPLTAFIIPTSNHRSSAANFSGQPHYSARNEGRYPY